MFFALSIFILDFDFYEHSSFFGHLVQNLLISMSIKDQPHIRLCIHEDSSVKKEETIWKQLMGYWH